MAKYRSKPLAIPGPPPGIPFIVANEAAERFSYYGMRAVLVVFMTQYLANTDGSPAPMSEAEAKGWFHLFVSAAYFTPILGAFLADAWLGKYRTIIGLSLVYCLGHVMLSAEDTRIGLIAGQTLIALGAGGIKPCVSAHLGDQFASTNRHLLAKFYGWFYFAINFGAFAAMLGTPWLLQEYGSSAAFGTPAILMFLATLVFFAGRHRFTHVPPAGMTKLWREMRSSLRDLAGLLKIYACVAIFWALFDQTGSSWVLQAQNMDREFMGMTILPAQIQAANPALIMLLVPVFQFLAYPALERRVRLTPLRKIGAGMLLAGLAFVLAAWIQERLDGGEHPSIGWQLLDYVILTAGEVMVSVTCLEFSYTQAPRVMKSLVMSLYLLSVAAGNLLTGSVNLLIAGPKGESLLAGADYFWFFAGLMHLTAGIFAVISYRFANTSASS